MTPNKAGVRSGAGRPKGRNAYGEATQTIRIPVSLLEPVDKFLLDFSRLRNSKEIDTLSTLNVGKRLPMPLYSSNVPAGFTSLADDFVEEYLDLNRSAGKTRGSNFFRARFRAFDGRCWNSVG